VKRRALAGALIAAGLVLLAATATHYGGGILAQSRARSELREKLAGGRGLTRVSDRSPRDPLLATPALPGYPRGQALARLKIPSARIDAIVLGGSDDDTLAKGPGHVPGTALPGEEQRAPHNCVITAHRDSHFRNLGWLRRGHRIELETPGGKRAYRVVSREVVEPSAVKVLRPSARPRLTLITCYPFTFIGPAPKRLVVIAE
jgi:sortase A